LDREIGVYPETKHPTYFAGLGLPLEEPLVDLLALHGLNLADAPVFVQSFELDNLVAMRTRLGLRARTVFLLARPDGYAASAPPDEALLARLARAGIHGVGPSLELVLAPGEDGDL